MASILDTVWGTGPQRLKRRLQPMGARPPAGGDAGRRGRLTEIKSFGADPGSVRMLTYAPKSLAPGAALVVVLHGCTQNAENYDAHAGWSALADELGFALLYPEQRRGNNPMNCFNWFLAADSARGLGEARSIREMVEHLVGRHKLDRGRIYILGLSAGGAMTANMLAAYPETFAAGAIIAGLPCGAAAGVSQALEAMSRPTARSRAELGDAVRAGAPYAGPWPRVSIWHGLADRTVAPGNAEQLVRQWLDVHGAPAKPTFEERTGASLRRVWMQDGRAVVEATTIDGMGHGAPLGGRLGERPGPYMLEVGVSSTREIAAFFGLKPEGVAATEPTERPAREGKRAPAQDRAKEPQASAAPTYSAQTDAAETEAAAPAPAAILKRQRATGDDPRAEPSSGKAASAEPFSAAGASTRGVGGGLRALDAPISGSPAASEAHAGPIPTGRAAEAPTPAKPGASARSAAGADDRSAPRSGAGAGVGAKPPAQTSAVTTTSATAAAAKAGGAKAGGATASGSKSSDDGARRAEQPHPDHAETSGRFDLRATIEKALRAAGLMR